MKKLIHALLILSLILSISCVKKEKEDNPLILLAPVANFSASPSTQKIGIAVHFTDSSMNSPTSWLWSFGDSATSIVQNPTHIYTAPGNYSISLAVLNATGSDTLQKQAYLTITMPWVGLYLCTGIFHHPTGGDRVINEEKYLTAISEYEVSSTLGDLGNTFPIKFTINPTDNSVTVTELQSTPYFIVSQTGKSSYYEPSTGKFYVWYRYVGATGDRLIDEVYTPK